MTLRSTYEFYVSLFSYIQMNYKFCFETDWEFELFETNESRMELISAFKFISIPTWVDFAIGVGLYYHVLYFF